MRYDRGERGTNKAIARNEDEVAEEGDEGTNAEDRDKKFPFMTAQECVEAKEDEVTEKHRESQDMESGVCTGGEGGTEVFLCREKLHEGT